MNVAIITDSFPPMVDGVSHCVLGYANALHKSGRGDCIVIAPRVPRVKYNYPFKVYPFLSVGLPYADYRAGHPMTPKLLAKLKTMDIDVIHAHSPFVSMIVARQLRRSLNVPVVFTQHTKWDYDLERAVPTKTLQKKIEQFAYSNIGAADEVWAVSRGTGEHLVSRGYKGDYFVMPNGTDFPKENADAALLEQINGRHGLTGDAPVFLFVGRMMMYKNIGMIIEALEILRKSQFDFRMIYIGDGEDLPAAKKMAADKGLGDVIFFTGRITDRNILRAYYTRSDLFIFPSVYDNAPLVVREAAACGCPSLVVRGSSTAEMLEDGVTGFFAEETPESVAETVQKAFADPERLRGIGKAASEQVYLPWHTAVERSLERYAAVKAKFPKI